MVGNALPLCPAVVAPRLCVVCGSDRARACYFLKITGRWTCTPQQASLCGRVRVVGVLLSVLVDARSEERV